VAEIITLAAGGDILFGRGVAEVMAAKGTNYPFEKLHPIFHQSDIGFANLEAPFTNRGIPFARKAPHVTFRANPSFAVSLQQAGINLVSLANNHITDYGEPGLRDTIQILDELGIQHVGAGRNLEEATRPAIFQKNGVTVAFLAFNAYRPFCAVATSRRYGVAPFASGLMQSVVKQAKAHADVVVVSLHWGIDYIPYPIPFQVKLAFELVGNGASLILGHHPHVVQGMETYRCGLIVYSLGDFLFDEQLEITKNSFILSCRLNKNGFQAYEIIPTRLTSAYQCEILQGVEKTMTIQHMASLLEAYHSLNRDALNELRRRWIILNLKWLFLRGNWRQFFGMFGVNEAIWASLVTILQKVSLRKNIQVEGKAK
jgi:poly-gamma-glutamate synthesis protein (capsule biosynthesis protein)